METEHEDFSLLTKEQKRELDEAAEKAYLQVRVEQARERYAKEARQRVRLRHNPDEKLCEVRVVLPASMVDGCPYLQLDNRRFYNNQTYQVNRAVRAVLQDQIFRAWVHDAVAKGTREEREYRQRMGMILTGSGATIGSLNVG